MDQKPSFPMLAQVQNSATPELSPNTDAKSIDYTAGFAWSVQRIARLLSFTVDRLKLHEAISEHRRELSESIEKDLSQELASHWQIVSIKLMKLAGIEQIETYSQPDPARLPLLTWIPKLGWGVIVSRRPDGKWLVEVNGIPQTVDANKPLPSLRLSKSQQNDSEKKQTAKELIYREFYKQRPILIESGIAGILINLIALAVSIYSMQVYDRVIPTQGYSTLAVLTLGVAFALIFDIVIKFARSYLMENAITQMDNELSRKIFARLLNIRLDEMPASVGSLSAQLRGYETIRGFLSSSTFYVFVDAPFGLIFILMIAWISTPVVALVPLVFLVVALCYGFLMQDKINDLAAQSSDATNKKTGILVETIEGAETIKSGGGSWNALSKWIDINLDALKHDMALRSISEKSNYLSAMLQQVSYVGLIATGAYFAAEGQMTMGALIACSILSGRAMSPITQIPGLIVQAAHAKAALKNLERVFALESDNHEVEKPLVPETIQGKYQLERVRFSYPFSPEAIFIQDLKIQPGEKIGVIGPIGSGKSTFLRLLSGMYQAREGRVLLDGLDIGHISQALLSEKVGYLQQDHRLFSATLRENLLIGIPDPGDDAIRRVAEQTGLLAVISNHPRGLDLMISEGGKGLSGGQRQLVAFTRLLLSQPNVWLLDEPTASMDGETERRCLSAFSKAIHPENTLVLVTHKPQMLGLVNRVIVIAQQKVLIDGPRDEVLKALSANANKATPAA